MKTYTITQTEINELSDLINDLMCLPTLPGTLRVAGRVAIKAQTILVNITTTSPVKPDNKCDKCGEEVAPNGLFWHSDERIGYYFCKECFRKIKGETETGYVTLEKWHKEKGE